MVTRQVDSIAISNKVLNRQRFIPAIKKSNKNYMPYKQNANHKENVLKMKKAGNVF